jgi:hypothetical protein
MHGWPGGMAVTGWTLSWRCCGDSAACFVRIFRASPAKTGIEVRFYSVFLELIRQY